MPAKKYNSDEERKLAKSQQSRLSSKKYYEKLKAAKQNQDSADDSGKYDVLERIVNNIQKMLLDYAGKVVLLERQVEILESDLEDREEIEKNSTSQQVKEIIKEVRTPPLNGFDHFLQMRIGDIANLIYPAAARCGHPRDAVLFN